ncbi:4-oxalocrotonate tautomerase family protein [Marinicauda algicola]|uniref:4-oxalocrotonate tautomerase family protein n=1 Tax=Marinicauda algicola TaxID=2029849 RepID=A0A4S2H063_9PROT|nr:4-oxalocrotonate tautomerase family protein [Marinicauda algicola]TGY88763.1 4-oxalocrotonate tautomerase family protein [Marinicauda algicola]
MPVVTIQTPAGALSEVQKAALISKVTDVVVEVEGFPALRPSVHVLIEEVPAGGYGVGGHAVDVEKAKAALAKAAAKTEPG